MLRSSAQSVHKHIQNEANRGEEEVMLNTLVEASVSSGLNTRYIAYRN